MEPAKSKDFDFDIKNSVTIVTGGASGIGKNIAMAFGDQGSTVYIADINDEAMKKTVSEADDLNYNLKSMHSDISQEADVKDLIDSVVEKEGKIDVVVNNAGINILKNVTELSSDEWDHLMKTNLKSVFLTAKYAIPKMIKLNEGGIFVNISSVSGIAADYDMSVYNAAKAGIINLTKSIAVNYGKKGIRANTVCPGAIDTALLQEAFDLNKNKDTRAEFEEAYPMGRIGTKQEVANIVLFLASELSPFINGAAIPVDGGITSHTGQPSFS